MAKNVLVVGMPRSGTSLTAAAFANKGFFVAESGKNELRDGDKFNPHGYFEADGLIERNAEVFGRVGYPHHNTWKFAAIGRKEADCILELEPEPEHRQFVESYNSRSPWVWKDPRLCYTLGYWWHMMDPSNTAVILLIRSPDDIYESFLRTGWRTRSPEQRRDTHQRVADHVQAARRAIDRFNIPYLEVNYSDYLKRPDDVAAQIGQFVGISMTAKDLNVDPDLNHSSTKARLLFYVEEKLKQLLRPLWHLIKRVRRVQS